MSHIMNETAMWTTRINSHRMPYQALRTSLRTQPIAPLQHLQYGLGERSSVGAVILNT